MERWAKVTDWPFVEVSDRGRVRTSYAKQGRTGRPLIRKPQLNRNGYYMILLSEGPRSRTRSKMFYIHRLVASAFVDGDQSLFVCHLDGIRTNNHYSNLVWASQIENMRHAIESGKIKKGEMSHASKICDAGVRAAIKMRESGFVLEDIAYFFGVSSGTVCVWVNGKSRLEAIKRHKGV